MYISGWLLKIQMSRFSAFWNFVRSYRLKSAVPSTSWSHGSLSPKCGTSPIPQLSKEPTGPRTLMPLAASSATNCCQFWVTCASGLNSSQAVSLILTNQRPSSDLQALGLRESFFSMPRRLESTAVKLPDLPLRPASAPELEVHCHVPASVT